MVRNSLTALLLASLLSLTACSSHEDDTGQMTANGEPAPSARTYVVFSPATSDLPIPNDLLFSSETLADGTMFAGSDPTNPVISGIDALDGNSVAAPFDISFSGPLDTSQVLDARSFIQVDSAIIPNPNQNVFLLPLTFPSGDSLLQASLGGTSIEVPTFSEAAAYQAAVASGDIGTLAALATPALRAEILSLDNGVYNTLRISPLTPLQAETKYLVVITKLQDFNGNKVYPSTAYDYIRDDNSNLGQLGLDGLRDAIQSWERLAAGYFGFMGQVFDAAGISATAPSSDDIILTLTFTTGGTDSILTSLAAPETFFEKNLRTSYKQDAIVKLVSGTYNLSGDNSAATSITEGAINSTLNVLLTQPILPGDQPNPLYNAGIAAAIANGADYATIASDATAAHIMQRAAAEAAISVHNSGSAESGDAEPYVDIATEAVGTVAALANAAGTPVNSLFPVPAARSSSFYRVDPVGDALYGPAAEGEDESHPRNQLAPALLYQGQINLPLYQATPSGDGSAVTSSRWQADADGVGLILDMAKGNELGSTPPSDRTTYRFPFPAKQANVTIPVMATLPEATTLSNFGVTKPANGWPVVIFMHGITGDRSTSIPMADALAFACVRGDLSGPSGLPCFATLAIDQPLHGITPSGSAVSPYIRSVTDPNYPPQANLATEPAADLIERHYDYSSDAEANAIAMSYDGGFGDSGSLFINLKNFEVSRDSMRQAILDLLNLNASIASMDIDGDGTANDIDPNRVYLVGHSLGGITAITFAAVNNNTAVQASPFSALPRIQAVAPLFAGGGVPRLLVNSETFGATILQGLAAASEELVQGRSGLESYLSVFQGVLDSVDPINFVKPLAHSNTGVLFAEIVGEGNDSYPSDQVIPNGADAIWGEQISPLYAVLNNGFVIDNFPAPLAGTEPLLALAGAESTINATASETPAVLVTRFTEGSHRTPVAAGNTDADPFTSAATFYELLSEIAVFFASNGVVDGSIVANPEVVRP